MVTEIGDELRRKIKKGKEDLEGLDSLLKELNEYEIKVTGYVSKVDAITAYKETLEDLEKSPKIYVNPRIKEEMLNKAKNFNLPNLTLDGIEYRFEKFPETSTQEEARKFIQSLEKDIELQMMPSKPLEKLSYKTAFNAIERIHESGKKATRELVEKELEVQGYKLKGDDVYFALRYCIQKGIVETKKIKGKEVFIQRTSEKSTIGYKDVIDAATKIYNRGQKPTKKAIARELKSRNYTFENSNLKGGIDYSMEKGMLVSQISGNKKIYVPKEMVKVPTYKDIFDLIQEIKDPENRVFEDDIFKELEKRSCPLDRTKIKRRLRYLVDEETLKKEKIEGKKVFIVPEKKAKEDEYAVDGLLEKLHESVLNAGMYYNGEIRFWKALSQQGLENVYKVLWDKLGIKGMKEEYKKKRPELAKKIKIPKEKLPEYVERAATDLFKRQEHPTGEAVTAELSKIGIVDVKDVNRILYNDSKAGKYRQEKTSDRKTVYLPVKKPEEKILEKKAPEIPLEEKTMFSEFPEELFLKVKKDKLMISDSGHFIPKNDMDGIVDEAKRAGISCLSFDMMTTYGIPPERKYDVGEFISKKYIMKKLGEEDFEAIPTSKRITYRKKPKRNKDAK